MARKEVVLKSNGRVLLTIPAIFGTRRFWFTSISDPERSVERTEYPDAQTSKMLKKSAYATTEPITLAVPYDEESEAFFLPLVKYLEALTKTPDDSVEFQVSERIGGKTSRTFQGATFSNYLLPGTDMASNEVRMLSVTFDYEEIVY
jgi:hypothetical protein